MHFGTAETRDIDLFLVADEGTPLVSHILDAFLTSVAEILSEVSAADALLWSINMTSNRLLCAHVYINRCHFSDVTLIPERMNSRFEKAYPRECTRLYLSAFDTFASQRVISLNEVVCRMVCTARSIQLMDGLPCVPRLYNKPAIIKNTLRLQRLRVLNDMGVVRARPFPWVFDINHEFDMLQPWAMTVSEGDVLIPASEAEDEQKAMGEDAVSASITAITAPTRAGHNHELEIVTLPSISVGMATLKSRLQEAFEQCSSALLACLDAVNGRVNGLDSRIRKVESIGGDLAVRLNSGLQRSTDKARDALRVAAGMVSTLRTATYLTGTKPILALKRVINIAHEKILPVLARKHVGHRAASVGDYLEANEKIAKEMAEQCYLPFNLIPENMAPAKMSKVAADLRGAAAGNCTDDHDEFWRREACAVRGMGMNLMGAFVVFHKILRVSGKLDVPPTGPTGPMEAPVSAAPAVPFSYWSEKRHFLLDLVAQADAIPEFRLPEMLYIPAISAVDGRMEFIASLKDRDVATICEQVPALDPYNAEFMLSMLGNMIGYIHVPIVGHVQSLQEGLGSIACAVGEMQGAVEESVEEFAKAPFMKHVQQLRELTFTLTGLADSIADGQPRFSWRKSKAISLKTKRKKNRRKKNSEGCVVFC